MDDDVKAMICEALELYKRELDIIEANRDRQIAIQEKGYEESDKEEENNKNKKRATTNINSTYHRNSYMSVPHCPIYLSIYIYIYTCLPYICPYTVYDHDI